MPAPSEQLLRRRGDGGVMITVPAGIRVLVATKPVDFRKGGDGLASLVREVLGEDPFSGTIFASTRAAAQRRIPSRRSHSSRRRSAPSAPRANGGAARPR
jgi:hypothetical protein